MKCSKCGQEFEGKFCPNCGEPADGLPKQNDASAPSAGRATVPALIGKLYAHMPKIFSILFAVFAALMLICFAGPVTKSELAEEFGGVSDSVYSYLSGSEEESADDWGDEFALSAADDLDFDEEGGSGASMQGICASLVAFAALAVVVAAVELAFAMYVPLAATKFKVGDCTFKLKSIFDLASLLLLFVIFLLGCILCANVGDDLGLSEPGAAPICIIFFSLFFGLLMISALFGRKLISLVWRGAKDEYEAQKDAARAKLTQPLEPFPVGKPQKPQKKAPTYKNIAVADSEEDKKKIVKHIKRREAVAYLVMILFLGVIGGIIAIIYYATTKPKDFWKVCKRGSIKAANIIAPFMFVCATVALLMIWPIFHIISPYSFFKTDIDNNDFKYWYEDMNDVQYESIHLSMSMWNLENSDENEMNEAPSDVTVYNLGYKELKKITDMSDEQIADFILHRQNFWDFKATDAGTYDNVDALLYIASADGLENVVKGYEKNVKPIIEAIDALNEYFDLDLTTTDYHNSYSVPNNFAIIFDAVCGKLVTSEVQDDDSKIEIRVSEYDYQVITKEQYAELEKKLQAIPAGITKFYEFPDKTLGYHTQYIWCMNDIRNAIWHISFEDPALSTRDAIIKLVNVSRVYSSAEERLYSCSLEIIYFMLPCAGIVYFFVLWILAIRMLITSNKYTEQVLGARKLKKTVQYKEYLSNTREKEQLYKKQLAAYKEYMHEYRGYRIDLAYYDEGIARKRSA